MPANVMVPLDGSTFAEQALPLALGLCRRSGARLHLVFVRASLPVDWPGGYGRKYLDGIAAGIESELPGRISHMVVMDELAPLEYPPPASNAVADVLLRHARECDADLILMTTHGHGGIRRAWLGSVADSLIRISTLPILLLRPSDDSFTIAAAADRGISHVVVPLDGSAAGEKALAQAERIGAVFGARYTLVRVTSPLAWELAPQSWTSPGPPEMPPLSRQMVADYLERTAAPMRERGLAVATQVLDGISPASAILDFAQTHAVDLIAMSTAGAGGIRRLLLGSVADKLVREGVVPMLVCNRSLVEEPEAAAATAVEEATA